MAHSHVSQWLSICQNLPANQLVMVTAGELASLITQLRTSQGSEVVITKPTSLAPTVAPINLSGYAAP